MNNEFVTYEQSLAVKELGFDEKCLTYYYNEILVFTPIPSLNTNSFWVGKDNNFITAPLKQQLFRWFREKYGLITSIRHNKFPDMSGKQYYFEYEYKNSYERYITYEEAENVCIDKLIELAKQK
jgi:hypothetical protein